MAARAAKYPGIIAGHYTLRLRQGLFRFATAHPGYQVGSNHPLTSGTSTPSAVAKSIWWSCSSTRICRISSAWQFAERFTLPNPHAISPLLSDVVGYVDEIDSAAVLLELRQQARGIPAMPTLAGRLNCQISRMAMSSRNEVISIVAETAMP
jgi:hypothetical protein